MKKHKLSDTITGTYVGTGAAESAIIGTASQSTCSAGSGIRCLVMDCHKTRGGPYIYAPTSLSDASSNGPSPIT